VLSGLSKLYKYTGDNELLQAAGNLIDSVLASSLVPANSGILVESCDPSGTCDQDQWMFKGIFFLHLGYFLKDIVALEGIQTTTKKELLEKYKNFIHANASVVWGARGSDGRVGSWWAAAAGNQSQRFSVETHGSGVAAVCCAVSVDQGLHSLEQTPENVSSAAK
jgi:hypothetical protein